MKHRSAALKARLFLYAFFILIFVMIPSGTVETSPFSICLIYNLFGIECLTCGVTRGVSNFFHGNFLRAWEFNPLTYPVMVLFALLLVTDLILFWKLRRDPMAGYTSIFEKLWRWVFRPIKK